ncbi:uncharacterized protein CEXT_368231 [Caerostris extrusa]|uniref:Uncharacterized protein n=1 Tax=Caerostris extrusa TaxID=172846 RepID=A0AAV4RQN3_CAEEX|nr:uncharacterized protein CEXT_368231 [Caerostris extrusa]
MHLYSGGFFLYRDVRFKDDPAVLECSLCKYIRKGKKMGINKTFFDYDPKFTTNRLEAFQNPALRLITGAVKPNPSTRCYCRQEIKPFQDTMKMRALILYEKLLRIEDPYWRDYVVKPRQYGIIQKFWT